MAERAKSDYFFTLDEPSKLRYLSIIGLINNEDPYMPGTGLSDGVSVYYRA